MSVFHLAETRSKQGLTDMNDSSFAIDHDVTVVTIFDLNEVAEERIGGHRLNEIDARFLEFDSIDVSVRQNIIAEQVVDFRSSNFISRRCIRDHVNHTTLKYICSARFVEEEA